MMLKNIMKINLFAAIFFAAATFQPQAKAQSQPQYNTQLPTILAENYQAIYPELPFDNALLSKTEFDRVDVWKEVYQRGENDESGLVWSNQTQIYQVFSAILGDKKVQNITYLAPDNLRLRRFDYYYINGLISAIDEMQFDEAGKDDLILTNIYFYEANGRPFQRVRTYPKDKAFREITAVRFDAQGRLIHLKTSYTGSPRHSQTLMRVQTGKELITTAFNSKNILQNTYQNYNELIRSNDYTLANDKEIATLRSYTNNNHLHEVATYEYTDGRLTKIVAELHHLAQTEAEHNALNQSGDTAKRISYFFYNADGLIARIIIEQGQEQTVLNYNYLTR
jgi:hypothetical protein